MTLANLAVPVLYPGLIGSLASTPTLAIDTIIDAASEYNGVVLQAAQDLSITHVGFYPGAVSGSGAAEIRIETVDASTGLPTGTLWATNTNIVTGALTNNTWGLFALTATATIPRGSVFCVKILYNAGTSFQTLSVNLPINSQLPYKVTNTGTPTASLLGNQLMIAIGSGSTSFYPVRGILPLNANSTTQSFNNTNSAKRGLRFQVPFKCRIAGQRWWASTSTGDFNAVLTDDSGNELSSSSTPFDASQLAAGSNNSCRESLFDSPVILSPVTWYRATIEPTTSTNVNYRTVSIPAADYMAAMPGGASYYLTTLASGVWTDTTTSVFLMDLILDQLDDGAGGAGGLLRHPGMAGGLNA